MSGNNRRIDGNIPRDRDGYGHSEEYMAIDRYEDEFRDDEYGDEFQTDLHRRCHDAAGTVEERIDHAGKILAAGEGVDEQRTGHTEDRDADAAAAELGKAQHADDPDGDMERGHL